MLRRTEEVEMEEQRAVVTAPSIAARKRRRGADRIVMVTAYDAPFARIVDEAGVDVILVGDSVADNVLGHDNTLAADVATMAHHVGAVARAEPRALVVGDMPWMSYHLDVHDSVRNAAALVRAGASAVKLEGGRRRLATIEAILDAEIPVMGHLGLTPQSVKALGALRLQARDEGAADALIADAEALAAIGCFAIVLEAVPDALARVVTERIDIPTIGIGAGPDCDGQVLVVHDILGLTTRQPAKFVRRYLDLGGMARDALERFAGDVRSGDYPNEKETYHASAALEEHLDSRR
jgi:3-methyl-2-oxobutanoate hydroxymethyltransferase